MSRWVRKDRRIYDFSRCKYCGSGWGTGCEETTCLACGTTQCMGNGLSKGSCSVCLVGFLPGWYRLNEKCGYKNCPNEAVAYAKRVGQVCKEHLSKVKYCKDLTLNDFIQLRLKNIEKEWELVE